MSSIDQAFIKAFARRNRSGQSAEQDRESSNVNSILVDESTEAIHRIESADSSTVPAPHVVTEPMEPAAHFRSDYVFGTIGETFEIPSAEAPVVDRIETEPSSPIRVEAPTEKIEEAPAPELKELETSEHEPDSEDFAEKLAADTEVVIEKVAADLEDATKEVAADLQADMVEADTTTSNLFEIDEVVDLDDVPDTENTFAAADTKVPDSRVDASETDELQESTSTKPAPLEPAWEVDAFEVPKMVARLFFEEELFDEIAQHMQNAVAEGLGSIVVTSAHAGEGRSTIAIGIALATAATGLRVALVDGDTEKPTLQTDLRLDLDYGWPDAIRGGLGLEQVAVHSIQDNVTLIPLLSSDGDRVQRSASATEVARLFAELEDQFDLIVIDGPVCSMPRIHQFASLTDTALIVRDQSQTDIGTLNELSYRLKESGVKGIGVVQNFTNRS